MLFASDYDQKAKEAIGVEKPLGKEGAGSMEPAGVMENQCAVFFMLQLYISFIYT